MSEKTAHERAVMAINAGPAGRQHPWASFYAGRMIGWALLDLADAVRETAAEKRRENDIDEAREERLGRRK